LIYAFPAARKPHFAKEYLNRLLKVAVVVSYLETITANIDNEARKWQKNVGYSYLPPPMDKPLTSRTPKIMQIAAIIHEMTSEPTTILDETELDELDGTKGEIKNNMPIKSKTPPAICRPIRGLTGRDFPQLEQKRAVLLFCAQQFSHSVDVVIKLLSLWQSVPVKK
jgi:hypothetical protein